MDLTFDLQADTPFSYACRRCRRCCHNQRIRLTPYEVLRLARNRGLSTRDLIERHTDEGGTVLRFRVAPGEEESTCLFLGQDGCQVHPDRPLACRLYPLGRHVSPDGTELFARLPGHPDSEGVFGAPASLGEEDTVGAFVAAQGAGPYIAAGERYFAVLQRLLTRLAALAETGVDLVDGDAEVGEPEVAEWMDVDAVTARFCETHSLPLPRDLEAAVDLHIRAAAEMAGPQ